MAFKKAKVPPNKEHKNILMEAKKKGDSAFIASCIMFFSKAGFLTPKQIEALRDYNGPLSYRGDPNAPWNEDDHEYDDMIGWDPFDPS